MTKPRPVSAPLALFALSATCAFAAHAGSHAYPGNDPKWKAECGSCHIAYPAQLLPAESWRRTLASLNRHFGVDASVEPAELKHIAAFLEANSAVGKMAETPPPAQITDAAWFRRKHRKVPAADWKSAQVKSAANCSACHASAEHGDFSERQLKFWK